MRYFATITRESSRIQVAYIELEAESREEAFIKAETIDVFDWQLVDSDEFRTVEECIEEE